MSLQEKFGIFLNAIKKRTAVFLPLLILAVFTFGFLVYFLNQNHQSLKAAPDNSLYLIPESGTVELNSSFSLAAMINPGSYQATAVELHISYDSEKLRLDAVDIEGSPFQAILQAVQIDNDSGRASIIVGVPVSDPVVPVIAAAKVAGFNFYALSAATDTAVSIAVNSIAAAIGETGNIIEHRLPAYITINGGADEGPVGEVSFYQGQYSSSTQAILSLFATSSNGVVSMKLSDSNQFEIPVEREYNTVSNWTLSSGDGVKHVYVWFKDGLGNWSKTPATDSIILDTSPPLIANVSVSNTSTSSVSVSWNTSENAVGQISYGLFDDYSDYIQVNILPDRQNFNVQISGLNASTTYHYRISAVDAAGNMTVGIDRVFATADQSSPVCTDFTYSSWSACQSNNLQTRTILSSLPEGCTDGDPILTQACAYTPPSSGGGGGGGGGGGTYTPPPSSNPSPTTPVETEIPKVGNVSISRTENKITLNWTDPIFSSYLSTVIIKSTEQISGYLTYEAASGLFGVEKETAEGVFIDASVSANSKYYYAIYVKSKENKYSAATVAVSNPVSQAVSNLDTVNKDDLAAKELYQKLLHLGGLNSQIVNEASFFEAEDIKKAGFVPLDETTRRLYNYIIGRSPRSLSEEEKYSMAHYVHYGTPTTKRLGAGERTGVANSYLAVFGRLPSATEEWQDVIKIANGRWPDEKNTGKENEAQLSHFKKVYRREAVMSNANDNAAVTVIAYGLRPALRNFESEKNGIKIFKAIYGHEPKEATEWDIVRAIAYSGAVR
jgi:hypothetical protein